MCGERAQKTRPCRQPSSMLEGALRKYERDTMATASVPSPQKLVLYDVDWHTYRRLLRDLQVRRVRLTYDRGALEIMTLSLQHERFGRFLGRLLVTLTEEFQLPLAQGGSTTFRRRKKKRGLESDNCYWIQNEHLIRGKIKIDLRTDPPPDVGVEIDIFHSSLNRMAIYAALKVPEVWRFDGKTLEFHVLQPNGKYRIENQSRALAGVAAGGLLPFLMLLTQADENALIRQFREWIRKHYHLAGQSP